MPPSMPWIGYGGPPSRLLGELLRVIILLFLADLRVPTISKEDSEALATLLNPAMLYDPTPGVVNFSDVSANRLDFPIVPICGGDLSNLAASLI